MGVCRAQMQQEDGLPCAAQTHILGRLPQDVPHAAAVPQPMVQHRDDAHEQRVAGAFPLLRLCFWDTGEGNESKDSEHREG